jgi:hypothetical protein
MNIRENLEKWLVTNCRSSIDPDGLDQSFKSGDISFTIGGKHPQKYCPVDITFRDGRKDISRDLYFFRGKKVDLVSQRSISHTPFIVYYLLIDGVPLKIIDFYQWLPSLKLYRIFLFTTKSMSIEIVTSFFKSKQSSLESEFIITSNRDLSTDKSENLIATEDENNAEGITVIGISEVQDKPDLLIVKDIFKIFHNQVLICRENHLNKTVRFKGHLSDMMLDKLWFSQKIIFPDGSLDIKDPRLDLYLPWLASFADLIQSSNLREQIVTLLKAGENITCRQIFTSQNLEMVIPSAGNVSKFEDPFNTLCLIDLRKDFKPDNHDFEELVYLACFTDLIPDNIIAERIQRWWDLYSQPLLRKKTNSLCFENPEKIFIILILAYRNQLRWANNLNDIWQQYAGKTFLNLILYIISQLSIQQRGKDTFGIRPGLEWIQNNKGIIFQDGNGVVKYTRFGKKIISSFSYENKLLFSCDRELRFEYSKRDKKLQATPNITLSGPIREVPNQCSICHHDSLIMMPFTWNKFEFKINDIRFRVIFKKKRFQITAICKKKNEQFEFNDQLYLFSESIKHTLYFTPDVRNPQTCYNLTDSIYRSVLIYSPNRKSSGYVSGWALNRFGIFPESYIYSFAQKRHIVKASTSGIFLNQFVYDDNYNDVTISFRHHSTSQRINILRDRLCSRFLSIDTNLAGIDLLLIFEASLKDQVADILARFFGKFGFYPEYLESEGNQKRTSRFVQIQIKSSHNDFKVYQREGIIEVGIKNSLTNIDEVFSYISSCINYS